MHIKFKNSIVNFKIMDTLIVSADTSANIGELCWLTWLQNQKASGWKHRWIVCVLSVTEWSVSSVATRISVPTYIFRTAKAITHFHFSEPLTHLCGTAGFRGSQYEKHWSIPIKCVEINLHSPIRFQDMFLNQAQG